MLEISIIKCWKNSRFDNDVTDSKTFIPNLPWKNSYALYTFSKEWTPVFTLKQIASTSSRCDMFQTFGYLNFFMHRRLLTRISSFAILLNPFF